jgi:hypothetical protein
VPDAPNSRESFADGVMDDPIGRSAHRHSLIEQTFMASHQFGYPCRIVDTGYGPSVPPVFLDMVLYTRRPSPSSCRTCMRITLAVSRLSSSTANLLVGEPERSRLQGLKDFVLASAP